MKNTSHLNFSFRFLFFNFSFLILASCSPQKKLGKSFTADVLSTPALQTAHVGISIFDPAAANYLFNYQGDKYFVPASNTKIPTCYAAMKYLGDSLVGLRYTIKGDSLYMQPTGDPSFLHPDFKVQKAFDLLSRHGSVAIQKPLFSDFLGSGWAWNDYQEGYMAQRSNFPMYGNVVRMFWRGEDSIEMRPSTFAASSVVSEPLKTGFDVTKSWEKNAFVFSSGNLKMAEVPFRPDIVSIETLLSDTLNVKVTSDVRAIDANTKTLKSQPTDSLLKPMMHRSDNFFAEQTLLMVSNEMLGEMNDAKIIDTLLKTDLKDLPQKPRWVDGSGLSRYNLFTPQDFVAILHKMQTEFGMDRIKEIFPTGGEGTLGSLYKSDSTFIYAKTGTLSGVVALSGFLYTQGGKWLIFSALVNNHQGSATPVRRAIETFIKKVRMRY